MIWNFDPEIAMTPTTEAGKAHAEAWIDAVEIEWGLEPADRESMAGEVAAECPRRAGPARRGGGRSHLRLHLRDAGHGR